MNLGFLFIKSMMAMGMLFSSAFIPRMNHHGSFKSTKDLNTNHFELAFIRNMDNIQTHSTNGGYTNGGYTNGGYTTARTTNTRTTFMTSTYMGEEKSQDTNVGHTGTNTNMDGTTNAASTNMNDNTNLEDDSLVDDEAEKMTMRIAHALQVVREYLEYTEHGYTLEQIQEMPYDSTKYWLLFGMPKEIFARASYYLSNCSDELKNKIEEMGFMQDTILNFHIVQQKYENGGIAADSVLWILAAGRDLYVASDTVMKKIQEVEPHVMEELNEQQFSNLSERMGRIICWNAGHKNCLNDDNTSDLGNKFNTAYTELDYWVKKMNDREPTFKDMIAMEAALAKAVMFGEQWVWKKLNSREEFSKLTNNPENEIKFPKKNSNNKVRNKGLLHFTSDNVHNVGEGGKYPTNLLGLPQLHEEEEGTHDEEGSEDGESSSGKSNKQSSYGF